MASIVLREESREEYVVPADSLMAPNGTLLSYDNENTTYYRLTLKFVLDNSYSIPYGEHQRLRSNKVYTSYIFYKNDNIIMENGPDNAFSFINSRDMTLRDLLCALEYNMSHISIYYDDTYMHPENYLDTLIMNIPCACVYIEKLND